MQSFEAEPSDKNSLVQRNLLFIAGLFIVVYALILSFAPVVRLHANWQESKWEHWSSVLAWTVSLIILVPQINKHYPNHDYLLIPIVFLLSGWGMQVIWRLSPNLGIKQTIWFSISSITLFFGLKLKELPGFLQRYKYLWFVLGLSLLALTLIIGVNPYGGGPRLWLSFANVYFQPSEPLKLLLIIYLSAYFAEQIHLKDQLIQSIIPTLGIILLTFALLISQRDLGTASIFLFLYLIILFATNYSKKLVWIIPLTLIIAGSIGYYLFPLLKMRIDSWLSPLSNASGSSYQVIQALISVASGGLFGTGPGLGSPNLIPVAVSDFIFSAIAEEMGLFGTASIIVLFLLLTSRAINISLFANTLFKRYLALGIASYYAIQSFLIIGGNIGLLPLTGVTLPLLSYGGSSLLTSFLSLLILIVISDFGKKITSKHTSSKAIVNVGKLFIAFSSLLLIANSYIVIIKDKELTSREDNPRWVIDDRYSARGDLLALDGSPISSTVGQPGNYQRQSNYPQLGSIVGYSNAIYGQVGLEQSLYPYLRGTIGIPFQEQWKHVLLFNQPPEGLDIKLNINLELQKIADERMKNVNGALVLLNAKTGELNVMASHPFYNPETVVENWAELSTDPESPLLNRVTQGAYPLGSAANVILLSSFLSEPGKSLSDLSPTNQMDSFCYEAIKAANTEINGIKFGCQKSFEEVAASLSPDNLLSTMDAMQLFSTPVFALPVPQAPEKPDVIENIYNYFMGDTGFYVSPIQMGLIAASLTNNGIMAPPALVNSYLNTEGDWLAFPHDNESIQVLPEYASNQVISFLADEKKPIWFSTGQALNAENEVITWYLGGTLPDWQGSPLSIAIVLEANNPALAEEIGSQLLTANTSIND